MTRASSKRTHERGESTFKRALSVRQQLCGWEALAALQRTRRGRYSCGTTNSAVTAAANERNTQQERAMRVYVELEGILSCAYMQLLGREHVI